RKCLFISLCFGFERRHIDDETIFNIGLQEPVVGFINLLDGDDFDVGGDVVFATEGKHLLSLGDSSDGRPGQAAAAKEKSEGGDRQRFLGCAHQAEVAVAAKKVDIRVDVVLSGDGVEDEVEAAGVLGHLVSVVGN